MNSKAYAKYLILGIIVFVILIVALVIIFSFADKNPSTTQNNNQIINPACAELGCPSKDAMFVGSINSDKFYECDCRYAKNILPENIICFSTEQEALADNRTKSEC